MNRLVSVLVYQRHVRIVYWSEKEEIAACI